MNYRIKIGKVTITMTDILMFVFFVFFTLKMLRAFSRTSVQGGIWNYIQLGFVALGFLFFFIRISGFLRSGVTLSLFLYITISLVNSLIYINFSQEWFFDYLMIPFPFCILIIAYTVGRHNDIEDNKIITVSFFTMAAIFIYYMIRSGAYSTRTGAIADVYYLLCLLPLMLVCMNKMKIIPMAVCGTAILLSGKRTGIITFAVMIVSYYVCLSIQSRNPRTYLGSLVALTAVIVAFVLIFRLINSSYNNSLLDRMIRVIEDQDSSGRYERWQQVTRGFSESTVTGWIFGHGNGAVAKDFGGNAHNDFLEILYDFGIFALGAYLSFVVLIIRDLVKMFRNKYIYAPQFMMCVICFFGISNFSFYVITPTYITAGMLTMGLLLFDYKKRYRPTSLLVRVK